MILRARFGHRIGHGPVSHVSPVDTQVVSFRLPLRLMPGLDVPIAPVLIGTALEMRRRSGHARYLRPTVLLYHPIFGVEEPHAAQVISA